MVLLRQAMQAHRLLLWIRNRHSRPICILGIRTIVEVHLC